jgi:hypothetical protein
VLVTWSDGLGRSNFRELTLTVRPARHGGHDGDGESGDHDEAARVDRLDAVFALYGSGDGNHLIRHRPPARHPVASGQTITSRFSSVI